MFELDFRYRFEAAHRFVGVKSKCATPHGHSWHIQLRLKSLSSALNSQDMTEDFSLLKSQWKRFVDETLDHSFFHHHEDPLLPHFRDAIAEARVLACPGNPTTELMAALCFHKAVQIFENTSMQPQEIYLEETPTNRVLCRREAYLAAKQQYELEKFSAWWNVADPLARHFEAPSLN